MVRPGTSVTGSPVPIVAEIREKVAVSFLSTSVAVSCPLMMSLPSMVLCVELKVATGASLTATTLRLTVLEIDPP